MWRLKNDKVNDSPVLNCSEGGGEAGESQIKGSKRWKFKGYLHDKTITSQNVRHRLRIILFCRKVMFRFQDIQDFLFSTIP